MCEIMEELNAKSVSLARKDNARRTAVKMLKGNKLSFEDIADYSGLTLEEVKSLAAASERQGALFEA